MQMQLGDNTGLGRFRTPCRPLPAAGTPAAAMAPSDLMGLLDGQIWLDRTGGAGRDVQVLGLESVPQSVYANVRSHSVIAYVHGSTWLTRRFDGRRLCDRVGPGDLALKSYGTSGEWAWDGSTRTLQVFLSPQLLESTGAEMFGPRAGTWRLRDCVRTRDDALFDCVGQLAREAESQDAGADLMVKALGRQLAVLLLRRHADFVAEPKAPRRELFDPARRQRILQFIENHLDRAIPVAELAAHEGLDVNRFARLFRATFEVPPHEYMHTLRLRRARELLADSSRSLADVACDTGFSDQSHFTRAFKLQFGEPPGAWRSRHLGSPSPN